MWAARIFFQWKCIHNYKLKANSSLSYPKIKTSLLNIDVDTLCDTMCMFVMEIWKQSSEEYPRETLYEIMLSIQNFLAMNGHNLKLLDNNAFVCLRNTVDNRMKQLSKQGIVRQKNQAQAISVEQEEHMWQSGILGEDTPEKLINTVLYLIGVHFTLCTCDEYKSLKVGTFSQLKIKVDPESNQHYLEYVEHHSKNHHRGIKSLHHKMKTAKAFENLDNPECCIIRLYEKYLLKYPSMDPKYSFDLYLRPLATVSSPNVWYSCQPIGVQMLAKVMAKLAHSAGLPG